MKIDRAIVDAFCKEAEIQADLDTAETMKCKLEDKSQNPKETQTPFSRINLIRQARLNSDHEKYMATVMRHRKNVFDLREQLVEQHQKVDALIFQHLQDTHAPELLEPLELTRFYDLSHQKVTVFQTCLSQFLVKLETAHAAFSASDQEAPMAASAQDSLQAAQLAGKALDQTTRAMNAVSHQFEDKGYGARAALTTLPRFKERGYEDCVMKVSSCEATQALTEIGNIINECKKLEATQIGAAYLSIEHAQQTQKDRIDALVREVWKKAQHRHFSGEQKTNFEYQI